MRLNTRMMEQNTAASLSEAGKGDGAVVFAPKCNDVEESEQAGALLDDKEHPEQHHRDEELSVKQAVRDDNCVLITSEQALFKENCNDSVPEIFGHLSDKAGASLYILGANGASREKSCAMSARGASLSRSAKEQRERQHERKRAN
ncbi:hypothetical protein QAD02_004226 [Eretmocerus hayati]|uniref:Uncharacterized protein n=1 Tax=Eretmocerus hayati TaxID=131215 RepID=A0ACC2NP46_9HYME|nr:hypothetical protein QAD02_004226 [Eretmocerus hayati]